MVIWSILRPFGVFYDHLVHFVFIWYIFPAFGIMYQEKSGNPDLKSKSAFKTRLALAAEKNLFLPCTGENMYTDSYVAGSGGAGANPTTLIYNTVNSKIWSICLSVLSVYATLLNNF
jgi:hypothetical protein